MKKIIVGGLLGLLIFPQLTIAAWWNPVSWFKKAPEPMIVQPAVTQPVPQPVVKKIEVKMAQKKTIKPVVKKDVTPESIAPVTSTTTAVVPVQPVISSADVTEFSNFADEAVSQLKDLEKQAQDTNQQINSDISEFGSYDPVFLSESTQMISSINNLISEIEDSINSLMAVKSQAATSLDMKYWRTTGAADTAKNMKNYSQRLLDFMKLYNQNLLHLKQTVHNTVSQQQTQIPDPAQMYKDCANEQQKANKEVLGEVSGGMVTQTQVNGLIKNKMVKDGFGYCLYLN